MLFNTITFLLFFLLFYTLYRILKKARHRTILIVVASYIFYGFWNSPFVLLLVFSTLVDFYLGQKIAQADSSARKKAFLALSICSNLGVLAFFKYYNLFSQTSVTFLSFLGIDFHPPLLHIVLPVGISFYTFQTLSYAIDVYRGSLKCEKDIWTFASYVSFFPQLVAGPILRASQFIPQINETKSFEWKAIYHALFLIVLGLFKKMVLADNLAPYVERIYDHSFSPTILDAWFSTYAFSIQIFMDFSGYSDIAIGLGMLLGYKIPANFNNPYAAHSFSDFWKRWHISLSSWLRDYLYISLGGNRKGKFRTKVNLMLTMLLGGLWHGATWSFVAWGGLHGVYLIIEHFFTRKERRPNNRLTMILKPLLIFHLVVITWVLFRADFDKAYKIVLAMVGTESSDSIQLLSNLNYVFIGLILISTLIFHKVFANRNFEVWLLGTKPKARAYMSIMVFMLFSIIALKGEGGAFIYFQF